MDSTLALIGAIGVVNAVNSIRGINVINGINTNECNAAVKQCSIVHCLIQYQWHGCCHACRVSREPSQCCQALVFFTSIDLFLAFKSKEAVMGVVVAAVHRRRMDWAVLNSLLLYNFQVE